MKKIAVLLSALLLSGSLYANERTAKPLLGLELGYGGTDVVTPTTNNTESGYHGGLKIGAEGDEYRVFLSGRVYKIDEFDSATSFGGEFQYLIHLHEKFNIFVGINGGMMYMELDSTEGVREISAPYIGGDVGVNFDLTKSLTLELGGRYMKINEDHTLGGVINSVDTMIQGYASIIFILPENY